VTFEPTETALLVEPSTGYCDRLGVAMAGERVLRLELGQPQRWSLDLSVNAAT
jgi:hypothetical protein